MAKKRGFDDKNTSSKKSKYEVEPTFTGSAKGCLKDVRFDFDHGVAVWLPELREITNNYAQFLNFSATEYRCVSRCLKYRCGRTLIGIIYLFKEQSSARHFSDQLRTMRCHGDYQFKSECLGAYLITVAEIEEIIEQGHNDKATTAGNASQEEHCAKIVIRNLKPLRKVINRVLKLCSVFGRVVHHEEVRDAGQNFVFSHLFVVYRYAVQCFAAKIGLDGKWIQEQNHPLAVEIFPDKRVMAIYNELVKRNKLLFQP